MPALRILSKKTTQEAALFMRFLLLEGASSFQHIERRNGRHFFDIGEERGALGIAKWLGMTWDELVEISHEQRRKKKEELERHDLSHDADPISPFLVD
jgi:hypothetical protein